MELPTLNWSSAQVKDGALRVDLAGERPKGWNKTFAATATLIGAGGQWGDVQLKKNRIKVTGVEPGVEERLRFFLEAVVQQANATHRPEDDDADGEDGDGEETGGEDTGGGDSDASDDPDAELTARFRAFGD